MAVSISNLSYGARSVTFVAAADSPGDELPLPDLVDALSAAGAPSNSAIMQFLSASYASVDELIEVLSDAGGMLSHTSSGDEGYAFFNGMPPVIQVDLTAKTVIRIALASSIAS